jgi:adenylate kinase
MSVAVYVSGLPGIGKTTAVMHLAETRPDKYVRLSFGEALRGVTDPDATAESFRGCATRRVDRAVIMMATANLARRIRDEVNRVVLIDSHAVTPAPEGLRTTPDTADRVAEFGYRVIVHLSAADVEERILRNSDSEGRTAMTASEIAAAETMQLSIVARYASLSDCPLYVVSAIGDGADVADRLARAITAGLGWATPQPHDRQTAESSRDPSRRNLE